MIWCAVISALTALAGFCVFPFISKVLDIFKLTEDGIVKLANDVDFSKDSFMVLDSNFAVVRGNSSSRSLFGPNFVGSSILEFIWDSEDVVKVRRILEELANSARGDQSILVEFKAYGDPILDEDFRWLESTMQKKIVKGPNGDDFEIIVTTRNVDDRKRAEMYRLMLLASKDKEQERINEAKMMYVTCVAHDLKTPLQSFSFAMNLLSQSNLTEEQMEIINNAQVSVDLMKLTVSQAMHISKVQSGVAVVPRKSTVSISQLIQHVKIVMDGYGSPVPITYHVSDKLVDYIITDEEWLWQMILNLLTNACKYTMEGFIKVTLEEADNGSMLLCSVSDTGIGIKESKFSTIFNAFNQAQSGQMEGTGLGLFGLRTRAEALGGSCGICNNLEYGQGCTVWFKILYIKDNSFKNNDLSVCNNGNTSTAKITNQMTNKDEETCLINVTSPLHTSDAQNEALQAKGYVEAKFTENRSVEMTEFLSPATISSDSLSSSKHTIAERHATTSDKTSGANLNLTATEKHGLTAIVIDDVLSIRKLMARVLLNIGFSSVDTYENGLKGLQAMKAKMVDVVFTDIQMPVMAGPEMVARFRAFEEEALTAGTRPRKQIIVAVTANRSDDLCSADSNFDFVCSKPIEIQNIQHIIQTCFSRGSDDNV